jgi:hypothetical protein
VDSIDTIGDAIAAARPAYDALTALAEDVEDEWSYINDLSSAWLDRFDVVADERGHEPAGDGVADAIPALIAEVAALDDPHRAIDWLSTFPQVLLIAVGERP